MPVTEAQLASLLDEYLGAGSRGRFLRRRLADAPSGLARDLSDKAARRFLARTLTLRELQEFARDIASAQGDPEAGQLARLLGPSLPHCCIRNAHAVARAAVESWLAREEPTAPQA